MLRIIGLALLLLPFASCIAPVTCCVRADFREYIFDDRNQIFKVWDEDSNGRLSLAEYLDMVDPPYNNERYFRQFDADDDGSLSLTEVGNGWFDLFNRDHNGRADDEELDAAQCALRKFRCAGEPASTNSGSPASSSGTTPTRTVPGPLIDRLMDRITGAVARGAYPPTTAPSVARDIQANDREQETLSAAYVHAEAGRAAAAATAIQSLETGGTRREILIVGRLNVALRLRNYCRGATSSGTTDRLTCLRDARSAAVAALALGPHPQSNVNATLNAIAGGITYSIGVSTSQLAERTKACDTAKEADPALRAAAAYFQAGREAVGAELDDLLRNIVQLQESAAQRVRSLCG